MSDGEEPAALLQGCSQIGHNRMPGQQAGGWAVRICPECSKPFEPSVRNQLFCTPDHNTAWNNRQTKRGRVIAPLMMAAVATRNGRSGTPEERERGKEAVRHLNILTQRFRAEDRAADPPRMDWRAFNALRYRHGFDPL